jgi:Flp pilus assembly protein TadB
MDCICCNYLPELSYSFMRGAKNAMSQQEFFQQPEKRNRRNQRAESASYYQKAGDRPKEEHPSTFEDAVPPYAYMARNTRRSSTQEEQARQHAYSQYQQPYRMRRGGQQGHRYWQNMFVRWAIIILLIVVLIHMLPFLVSVLLVILGVLAVALLLPIFIIFGMIAAFAVITLIVLKMLGIPIRWSWIRARIFGR